MKSGVRYLITFNISIIFLFVTNFLISQPSTPTVSGLGYAKFVDFPISPFTGTFSYSVPIATVTAGSLSVPVSIDYHSGGNRVGDPASNVGLGWNLNYGGYITRTIKGVRDDKEGKGYSFNPTPNTESCPALQVADGQMDGEPDIFTWMAGGQGGKFYFDRYQNVVNITKTSAIITNGYTNIQIILDNGTKYFFESNNEFKEENTWIAIEFSLKKVVSYDRKDSIVVNYNGESQKYGYSSCAMPIKYGATQSSMVTKPNSDLSNGGYFWEKTPNEIIGTNNKIVLNWQTREDIALIIGDNALTGTLTPKRLSSIDYINGDYCYNHQLSYEYFHSEPNPLSHETWKKRLKLTSIQKKKCYPQGGGFDIGVENEPPLKFEYYGALLSDNSQHFPTMVDKNIDHFGYYNKVEQYENANSDMIEQTTVVNSNGAIITVGNANRKPSFDATLKGMLKKVTLPTKGTIEYTFEKNDYSNGTAQNITPINLSINCGNSPISQTILVTNDIKTTGTLSLSGTAIDNNSCGNFVPKYAYLNIYNSSNVLVYSDNVLGFTGTFSKTILLSSISAISANESYKFQLNTAYCNGALTLNYTNSGEYDAPGLRIKQIRVSDGINSSNDIIKNYSYKLFSNNNKSSGFLVNTPLYGQAIQNSTYVVFTSYNIKSLYNIDGFGVGYENVTIDYNGNGTEKLTFHKELEVSSGKYPREPNQSLIGRNLDNKKYDINNTLVSSNTYSYEETHTNSDYFHLAFRESIFTAVSNAYRLKTNRWLRVTSETSNVDGVSSTTSYLYNTIANPPILGPTTATFTNSDGKVTKTYTKYTSVYEVSSSMKNALISKNINIPYEVLIEVDNNYLSGSRTLFGFFDLTTGLASSTGVPRPTRDEKYERTWNSAGVLQAGSWTTQKSYSEYGHRGKLTKYNEFGYQPTTLEYEPNSYNLTKETFLLHQTQREYFPNSTMLKKTTDIDGTTISYDYDVLMRLWRTKDNNKDITKTYIYYFSPVGSSNKHSTTTNIYFGGASNSNSSLTNIIDITYYDNLERPIQIVKKGQSPTNKDIVTSMEYDKFGHVIKEFLPVESTGATGDFLTIQPDWKHTLTSYETSPLSRKKSVLPPDWYATTYSYGSNLATDDGTIVGPKSGFTYPDNSLFKSVVTDPNGNKSIAFMDKKGRTIMTAQYSGTTLQASVNKKIIQNVYDLKDRLEAVVVPGATWTTNTDLNYYYSYDGEDMLIYKKLPSRGEVNYLYNNKDLLAAYRDNNNNIGTSKWFATSYDDYGRELMTGLALTQSFNVNSPSFTDVYTENIYGTAGIEIGKLKVVKSKVLGSNPINWLQTTYTYDPTTGRLSSTAGNHHLNVSNTSTGLTASYIYDKGGNLTNNNVGIIGVSGGTNLPVNYTNKVDHIGRNTENIFQYNSGAQTTLSKQVYNHREELIIKYQGKTGLSGVNEYLQEINFTYLTNGLLKAINQGYHNTSNTNITPYTTCSTPNPTNYSTYNDKDLFYLELYYDQSIPGGPVPVRKNGEVSAMRWQTKGRSYQNYLFTYDYLGQMTLANYRDFNHATNSMVNTGRFSELISYDIRGNITTLTRVGASSASNCSTNLQIDNLTYNYTGQTGNRLHSITDAVAWTAGQNGFKPATGNYTYDANGNITADPYKGITGIIYNVFNKPTRITKSDGKFITFTYDGSGGMLSKSIFNAGGTTPIEKRDYIGNFEYVNGVLESVMHSEGRYRSATAKHEYHFKDHLGNTRLVYCDLGTTPDGKIDVATEILQESHYYPYGLEFNGHYIQQSGYDYRYKFNDIERLKDLDVGIDMAYYRGLDPTIGRWMQVDPKSELMYGFNPYNSMNNSPLMYIDPNGDNPLVVFAIAGAIGGAGNLYSNWGNIKGFSDGFSYFVNGAVGGAVSVVNPLAGAAITSGANLITDKLNGTLSDVIDQGKLGEHLLWTTLEGLGVTGAGNSAKALAAKYKWIEYNSIGQISAAEIASYKLPEDVVMSTTTQVTTHAQKVVTKLPSTLSNAAKVNTVTKFQKHHVIPNQIYKIFKSDLKSMGWKQNDMWNLKNLPSSFHSNHPAYNKYILNEMNILKQSGNLNLSSMKNLQHQMRIKIGDAYRAGGKLNHYF